MAKHQNNYSQRESNYDLLRILCSIAVIVIHVSATYKSSYTDTENPYKIHIVTTLIYNTLSRFAVPCFMMLSGAFLLSNDKNKNYKYFYRKTIISIGIPTLVFSIAYFLYREGLTIAKIILKEDSYLLVLEPIKYFIIGEPFYHMWYLYTLIGVYILLPFLIKLKDGIGEKNFKYVSWIYLIIATCSAFTSTYMLNWSISKTVCYIGFVFAGYQIRNNVKVKNNLKGILLIFGSVILLLGLTYIQYNHTIRGLSEADEKYTIVGNFNPIVVIASLLIFAGFSNLSIKSKVFNKLANYTFTIYLFHAGIWHFGSFVFFNVIMGKKTDPIITIPISVVLVFIISWICAIFYNKLWSFINKNDKVSNMVCSLLRL